MFLIFVLFFSLVGKTTELKKIDRIEAKQIKSDFKLRPKQLEAYQASQSGAVSSLLVAPKKETLVEPIPRGNKWPEVPKDSYLKIFPVLADSKQVYVSFYGDSTTISHELTKEVKEEFKDSVSRESFYIQGEFVEKILNEMSFSKSDTLFWFSFEEKKLYKLEIEKIERLLVKPNAAGGELFGTIGIEVNLPGGPNKTSTAAIGLASIGKKNPFSLYESHQPTWTTASKILDFKENALDLANAISPVAPDSNRSVIRDLNFQSHIFSSGEFIKIQAAFKRKDSTEQGGYDENLYGYFIRINQKLMTIYDFYIDSTYYKKPEVILTGQWIEGYDFTAYISSTGMGDCGKLILVKGSEAKTIPVRCGSWGC